ncbi:MAG: DNA adenine methylase, partial [Bacteroidota bacterium]|nr:DNA adenine methylase [Bacteroidota bacterium]
MDIEEEIKLFPTTRYQGSKRKIVPWIYDCIKDLEFNTVLDAFAGSGMVSYLFKKMDKSVTFNDILKFNQIIGDSIIANNQIILNDEDVKFILNRKTETKIFIATNFNNIYYLHDENIWIDNIICNIESLNE